MESARGPGDRARILGPSPRDWPRKATEDPRDGVRPVHSTYLLPLLSSHLPLLLFISLIPYEDLLDTFWCILGTKDNQSCQ